MFFSFMFDKLSFLPLVMQTAIASLRRNCSCIYSQNAFKLLGYFDFDILCFPPLKNSVLIY